VAAEGRAPGAGEPEDEVWALPSERYLHEWVPAVQGAQSAWMSAIDSLRAPDRKTHELIRMVCTVIARSPGGVERHAKLAAEVGATWDEVAGSILLTEPAFGIMLAMEALPYARRGFKAGSTSASAPAGEASDTQSRDTQSPDTQSRDTLSPDTQSRDTQSRDTLSPVTERAERTGRP
jgi:alkylhydroperoxidase/carboxymuconolactone decarboxylase family protein YurZ